MRVYNLTTAEHAINNIKNKRLKVARFDQLNDPFELLAVDLASKDLRAAFRAKKSQINSEEGLLCFTKNWRNPLLWSHYAEKHAGICLGFDVPESLLTPVRYIAGLQKVNLPDSKTTDQTIKKFFHRLRFTKFKGWTYEEEMRQIVKLHETQLHKGLHFVPFSDELCLREVILGPRCTQDFDSVRRLVEGFPQVVYVTKARIAFTIFGVVENRAFRQNSKSDRR